MSAGLERLTVADLTVEHIGVRILIERDGRAHAGGLSDITQVLGVLHAPVGAPDLSVYLLHLGGEQVIASGDQAVLVAVPLDPCDGTPLTDEPARVPAARTAPAPATPQETDDDDLPAVAQRPAAPRAPRTRPRAAVRRTLAVLERRARRAHEPRQARARVPASARPSTTPRGGTRPMTRALALAVLLAGAAVVVALASPPLSGGTITAALLVLASGAVLLQARRVATGGAR
ncbi:hypothetical protein [Sanguibacter sp. HDW7]|uniref:hypothetical protein n=1 Tax=Sanguibacter sp. HDW7 TaxID=2714931 RepID=UPI001408A751|nr:hypothetical protein [Sanguibacter sp. HDW7]QIK83083.1 hypothetical protein G7063_05170 [Sanguibacter sp. HDW7]